MKIKNIVFSGAMAAIILNVGAASAATQIASKTYVDNNVATKASKLTGDAVKTGNIATIAADGSYAAGTIAADKLVTDDNIEEKVAGALGSNETIQETITNIITAEDGALSEALKTKADIITVADGLAGNIATVDGNGQYQVSTTKISDLATKSGVDTSIADAIADALAENGDIAAELDKKVDIAQGADNANKIMVTDANGNVTSATSIAATKVSGLGELATVAPSECSSDTALCVLAFDGENYSWVNVTAPVGD